MYEEKIKEIEKVIFRFNGEIEDEDKNILIIKPEDENYDFPPEGINEAWKDFKGILSILRENKFWINYSDNEPPDYAFPEAWRIYIDLDK